MLKRFFNYLDFHRQALRTSIRPMLQSPLSTFSTLLVLAITLMLPTLFWTASDNLKKLSENWNAQGQLTVYFKTSLSEEELNVVQAKIHNVEGIADTRFVSAEEGLKDLGQQEGMQDVLKDLPKNPLPAATIVIPDLSQQDQDSLVQLKRKLQSIQGVDIVKLDIQWIQRLQAILKMLHQIANLIILILGIAVVLIISNTLRLSIQNNQEEIRILKLIGAPDRFILRPFLYAGIIYGFFAAIVAVILSNICLSVVAISVEQVARQYDVQWPLSHTSLPETISILFFSIILGWLAALISVKKQVRYIEPEM